MIILTINDQPNNEGDPSKTKSSITNWTARAIKETQKRPSYQERGLKNWHARRWFRHLLSLQEIEK